MERTQIMIKQVIESEDGPATSDQDSSVSQLTLLSSDSIPDWPMRDLDWPMRDLASSKRKNHLSELGESHSGRKTQEIDHRFADLVCQWTDESELGKEH